MLKGNQSPVSFILQSRDVPTKRLLYYDEEKKKNRSLRYASNQTSPFQDEQDENSIMEPIIFEDGSLVVPSTNPVLYEFLKLHPGNGEIFYEWDPAKEAEERLKMEDLILDAKIEARSMSVDKMASVVRIFTGKNSDKMSPSELKWEVMRLAENDPEEFLNAINDPELALDDTSFRAIKDGYVSVRNGGRDVHYNLKDNKKRMFSVPMGESAESALAAWLQSEDGQDFYMFLVKEYEK